MTSQQDGRKAQKKQEFEINIPNIYFYFLANKLKKLFCLHCICIMSNSKACNFIFKHKKILVDNPILPNLLFFQKSTGNSRSTPRTCSRGGKNREKSRSLHILNFKYKWTTDLPTKANDKDVEQISYQPHSIGEAMNAKTALEAWTLLLSDSLLEKVVQHTNEEIDAKLEKVIVQWYQDHTSLMEIKALLGIFYLCGIFKASKCNPEDLWSEKSGLIQFRATMSLNRFKFLVSCLRFDDKNTREQRMNTDRFAPVREIWDEFIENCKKYYSPSEWCTIDEQLLGFRGRCPFRIYTRNKADRNGIKVVMLNDAKTGYMINAIPYTGLVENDQFETIPEYYVRKLSEPIHGSKRNVTTDNWFTSVSIVERMLNEYSLTMLGAMRKGKREIPEYLKSARKPGTTDILYDHNKMLISYVPKKNKVVLLLSSLNQNPAIDTGTGKPLAILDYNRTKKGTEMFDQFCRRYTTWRKTLRWTLRIFFGMLDQSAVNSCILYNLNGVNESLAYRQFLLKLSTSLTEPLLRLRATNLNLQRTLRNCIAEMLSIKVPPPQERNDELPKRLRCHYCVRNSDTKTKKACNICRVPVCPKHRRTVCCSCCEN